MGGIKLMGITNPIPPPAIAFSKNIINVLLRSDNYLTAPAAKSVNFLEFTGAVAASTAIELTWALGAATLTAEDIPDDGGFQFPTGDGGNAYVTSLAGWFESNYFIGKDYVVTVNTAGAHPMLVFTARNFGPDYDFTDTDAGIAGVTTGGVTDQPRTNFAHHLRVYIGSDWDGSGFDEAFEANIPLDYPYTGDTNADVHEALHAFLDSDYPELNNPYSVCQQSIRPWFFYYAQYYGDPAAVRKVFVSDTFYVNKGGLAKQQALLKTLLQELCPVDGHPEQNRFLRQGSVNKLVATDQPEWLTWINLTAGAVDITLEVKVYNTDASTLVFTVADAFTAAAWQKLQFQCGYAQLGIAGRQPGKTVSYYTCQVKAGAAYLSLPYAFVLDYTPFEFPRYFVYENSYGAFQTIATVGKGQIESGRTKTDAQRSLDLRTAAISGDLLETNILIQEKGTVAIGYRRSDKRNIALLRDLMLSRTRYLYDAGNLIPIGILNDTVKDVPDGANVDAEQIIYYPLYQEEVWTEPSNQPDDAVADLLIAAGAQIDIGAVEGDYFYVHAGDAGVGVDSDGNFTFVDPEGRITGRTGYTVYATQLPAPVLPPNITYDPIGGSFSILVPEFALVAGYPLIVFTRNIDVL
jgi:hypothetical protein